MFLSAASFSGQAPAFETVSVKPSPATGSPAAGGGPNDPVTFSAHRITLKLLIASAYDVPDFQVSGGAAWTASDMFDIDAKAGNPSTQGEKMLMLRALLADRFQLAIHREQATLGAYALVVAKEGPKFHAAQAGDRAPAMVPGTLPVRSMKQLASILTMYFRFHMSFPSAGEPPLSDPEPLPVIDQTGLTGEYDTILDLRQSRDWFVVLQQQLGLKLEARKVPAEILAIDRAVKPGSNQ
jgi:uncharacterized protein (TIGR03435 family)